MRLVADEGVDRQVVDHLRRGGHDVVYIAELEPGLDDARPLPRFLQWRVPAWVWRAVGLVVTAYFLIGFFGPDDADNPLRVAFGNEASDRQFIIDAHLQYEASFDAVDSRTLVGVEYNDMEGDNDTWWGPAPGIDWTNPVYTGRPANLPLIAGHKECG